MEKLKEYLAKHKASYLAAQIGRSPSFVSDLRSGHRKPSLQVAFAIEDATGGAVPARAWLDT
jgi:DNA-binding transcriptional regulator YdaS (Cro superfamily)